MTSRKIDQPPEHWDQLFAPSSCLAVITTVDEAGRVNAASFGTCTRVCHDPVYIAFTVGTVKHTAENIRATGEFVVNLPPFERDLLEKVRVVGLPFERGVCELDKAGLTAIPAKTVRPPRIQEFPRHFECRVEWTREWVTRTMVCGRVVAVSVDEDCVDAAGKIVWDRAKPAHFCGRPYEGGFVAAYEAMSVGIPYDGPEALRFNE
jgi:flavin reductase (DIM6/NTAB) family NADH-FMN oxidoreductase RutF